MGLSLAKWQQCTNERGKMRSQDYWADVTNDEVTTYLSILFHMVIKKLPEVTKGTYDDAHKKVLFHEGTKLWDCNITVRNSTA